MTDYLKV